MHNKRIGRDDLLKIEVSIIYLESIYWLLLIYLTSGLVLLQVLPGDLTPVVNLVLETANLVEEVVVLARLDAAAVLHPRAVEVAAVVAVIILLEKMIVVSVTTSAVTVVAIALAALKTG